MSTRSRNSSNGQGSRGLKQDHSFRYLVKVWIESLPSTLPIFKKEFPPVAAVDLGIVSVSLQEMFIKASFYQHFIGCAWSKAWTQYYQDMKMDGDTYLKMVLYACITVYDTEEPFYERLLDVFGLVSASSLMFSVEANHHVYAAPLMMEFFHTFMRDEFYASGGWTGFEEHLQGVDYLRWYFVRADLPYRNIRRPLANEICWRWVGRQYHEEIRFLSTADADSDKQCSDMSERVKAMDLREVDPSEDLTAESVVADTIPLRALKALQEGQKEFELSLEDRECREKEVEREIVEKVELLERQKKFESKRLNTAGSLVEDIKKKLAKAEGVSKKLKKLYDLKADSDAS